MSDGLLRLSGLWPHTSARGARYLAGRLGGVRLLVVENAAPDRGESAPTHYLLIAEATDRERQADRPDQDAADTPQPTHRATYRPDRRSPGF